MKNITVIPLVLSLFMIFTCTSQDEMDVPEMGVSELKSNRSTQEANEYLYEREIHYLSTVSKINTLKKEKEDILIAIEKGDKSAVEKLERIQKEERRLNGFMEFLLKLPDMPIKFPPKGCLDVSNCDPKRDLSNIAGIILEDSFKEFHMEIADFKNNSMDTKTERIKNDEGQMIVLFETRLEGSGHLQISSNIGKLGKITSEIPISISK
ncbi:hypothetical protein M8845_07075 [Gelidibacter japonicus]|uniref:hypothetical protein n=1 Tax=Gelidibacter japonicus TaxID=1962232 RepID=UPI0020229709|nr:hypothetical protein [Gelidibacter japonicus]MCL8007183.1 hypothetical protein [Gelidibacter japonicus]